MIVRWSDYSIFHCKTIHLIEFLKTWIHAYVGESYGYFAYWSCISIDASHSFLKSHKIQFLTMPPIYRMTFDFFLRCCLSSFFSLNSIFRLTRFMCTMPMRVYFCMRRFQNQSYKWEWWWFVFFVGIFFFSHLPFMATLDAVKNNLLKLNHRFNPFLPNAVQFYSNNNYQSEKQNHGIHEDESYTFIRKNEHWKWRNK